MNGERSWRSALHMTVAAPALSSSSVRPARVGGFDATWLLWIAIIAVLLFLVVSPFVYLVVTSFTAERTGGFTFANYAVAWGRARYVEALFNSLRARRRFRRPGRPVRHSARLGRVAHQHAGARLRAHAGAGDFHHAALHRRGRLDPACRPQCRLAQPLLHVRHRRRGGTVQHLQLHRPGRRHRALFVSLHLHLHLGRARAGVLGDGGRRQHPGGRDVAHHAAGHPAACPAGDPGRPDHLLPRSHRAVRLARDDRHSRRASTWRRPSSSSSSAIRCGSRWPRPMPCRCSASP